MRRDFRELMAPAIKLAGAIPLKTLAALKAAVSANLPALADENADQLFAGKDANDNDLKPSYAPLTVFIKKKKKQPHDRVTLKDTGDFHRSIKAVARARDVLFVAEDPKTRDLQMRYGSDILGLSKKGLANLRPALKAHIARELKRLI
jgi:hypothetical protein